jgi:hypothetical protein
MKAEFSSLNSRLSVLESSTKVDPVPPSPESQEDEVDRKDDEISVARSLKIGRKPFRLRRRGKRYFRYVPHEGVDPRP